MNYDRQTRECVVCHIAGMAPDVVPYLGRNGHAWAHPICAQQAYEAKRQPIPEIDFAQYADMSR